MEANSSLSASLILGRELAAHSLKLPQITAADRRRLAGDGLFKQALRDDLIGLVLLLDAGIEHLARGDLDDVADVAAIVALCHVCQTFKVDFSVNGKFGEGEAEKALPCLAVRHIHNISSSMRPVLSTALSMRSG